MKISGITPTNTFAFPALEKDEAADQAATPHDVVSLNAPDLLSDDEVDGVLNDTISMIAQDSVGALSVHSGLSASRVASLLSM